MAYVRKKKIKGSEYYYLVEGYRDESGKVRQQVIRYLGKHDSIESARAAAASEAVVPKDEKKSRYWVTVPWRLGYNENLKPMFPVFLSKEAAQNYGGPGMLSGESTMVEYEVLGFDGPELAAELRGTRLGANYIAIWGADYRKHAREQKPEILSRRAFMKRLERTTD